MQNAVLGTIPDVDDSKRIRSELLRTVIRVTKLPLEYKLYIVFRAENLIV
jgi:hypothetical protein